MSSFIRTSSGPKTDDPFSEGLLSSHQMALLFGVTHEQVQELWAAQKAVNPDAKGMTIPDEWIARGRQISALMKSVGVDSVEGALEILESQDRGDLPW